MNANELADELDKSREEPYTSENLVAKAATMLRQQQAEIESLKKEAALQRLSDFTQEAEHEPVAWLWTKDGKPQSALLHEPDTVPSDPYWKDKGFKAIPLYTHPVKEQELLAEIEALNIELAHYKPNGAMGTVFIFEEEQEK